MTSSRSRTAEHRGGFAHTLVGAAGVSQLILRGGEEITGLVAEMHSVIARGWTIFDADASRVPLPYRLVAQSFSALATLASALPRSDDAAVAPDQWGRFVSALNGVMGDKLAAWDNALAIPMSVRTAQGGTLDLARSRAAGGRGLVLFVHGLCVSELAWQTPAHQQFVSELEQAGYAVGWLRYNSGRAIPESGREFAALLEAELGNDDADQALVLIGHSMGGLVIRSACHWAAAQRHTWLRRLTHAAYLGSPHHGAPLERAGNLANGLLGLTAYSAPFMRLGNIRSRGIKDLRFGSVTTDETAAATDQSFADRRRSVVPLPEHVRHLLVAASLRVPAGERWIGDGLVPVDSALGQHRETALSLTAPQLQRTLLAPLNHIALMGDARTCETLRAWIGEEGFEGARVQGVESDGSRGRG